MLNAINSCLKSLEKSYSLNYREVAEETNKLNNLLQNFKTNNTDHKFNKSEVLNITRKIEKLSIQNEYKLSLTKDFPEYFSNIKLKK